MTLQEEYVRQRKCVYICVCVCVCVCVCKSLVYWSIVSTLLFLKIKVHVWAKGFELEVWMQNLKLKRKKVYSFMKVHVCHIESSSLYHEEHREALKDF